MDYRRQQKLASLGIQYLPALTRSSRDKDSLSDTQNCIESLSASFSASSLGYGRERRNSFGQSFPFTSCNTGAAKNDIGGLRNAMTIPAKKCPNCANGGATVWVIPGKCCPVCGANVN